VKRGESGERQLGSGYGTADGCGCAGEHAREYGVLQRPDIEAFAHVARYATFGLCVLQGLNVRRIMKFGEAFDRHRVNFPVTASIEPAQLAYEFQNRRVPDNAQGMIAGEGCACEQFATEEDGLTGRRSRNGRSARRQTVRCQVLHGTPAIQAGDGEDREYSIALIKTIMIF
jgi:hypothetical protein